MYFYMDTHDLLRVVFCGLAHTKAMVWPYQKSVVLISWRLPMRFWKRCKDLPFYKTYIYIKLYRKPSFLALGSKQKKQTQQFSRAVCFWLLFLFCCFLVCISFRHPLFVAFELKRTTMHILLHAFCFCWSKMHSYQTV